MEPRIFTNIDAIGTDRNRHRNFRRCSVPVRGEQGPILGGFDARPEPCFVVRVPAGADAGDRKPITRSRVLLSARAADPSTIVRTTMTPDGNQGPAETEPGTPSRAEPRPPADAAASSSIGPAFQSAIGSIDSQADDPTPRSALGPTSAPAAQQPARGSMIEPPAASAQPVQQPGTPASTDSLRTSRPGAPSPTDLTRTSQPAPLPSDPTRTSQPDRLLASPPRVPRPAMAPQFRDQGRYDILGEHGRGGLGRVSRAHDRELGRDIAIKELISRGNLSEVRFLREALITARLEHPGIVPVYEAGRWSDGTPFYAMKLVSGRPLRDLIAERKTVDERIGLLHHVIAVADALAYAHGRGIIHRDLKPANVIVGEFGETVVIDWGLAKDLSAAEETTAGGGPFRANHDDGLTSAGTVLGTPAYMSPEQARGEPVDQRTDVFAIGAMLWELCTLHKLPPSFSDQRRHILRKAGIDPDLTTIVEKAVDPDPAYRYPDAEALAADLKAFKAGARIAARRYSPWGLLTHWTRRHRTLTIVSAAGLLFALAGIGLYIHNITAERDRADTSQRTATASLDALMLKHAELLLTTDPSAALDSIASYRGDHVDIVEQMRAEALGRGVAVVRLVPHTDAVLWAQGIAGGEIVTLSKDGTISRTDARGKSTVMARDVKRGAEFTYAASRHLLAYVCEPDDLCLLEITHGRSIHVPAKDRAHMPVGLSFSPDDSELALLSATGDLRILDIALPDQPVERFHLHVDDTVGVIFADRDTIAVGISNGLVLVHRNGGTQKLIDPDGSLWDSNPSAHQLVLATNRGEVLLADTRDLHIAKTAILCHGAISGLKVLPRKQIIAFACKEGTIGIWSPGDGAITPKAHLEGHANLLEADASGGYLVAAGDSGVLTVIDLETSIICILKGQQFRLTAISPPTAEYPLLLSADLRGALRVWPLPDRAVRVAADFHTPISATILDASTGSVLATDRDTQLLQYSAATVRPVATHEIETPSIEPSASGRWFATYGASGVVEVWSLSPLAQRRKLRASTHQLSHVSFMRDTEEIITSDRNGNLIHWPTRGGPQLLHRFAQSIESFLFVGLNESLIVALTDGTLLKIDKDRRITPIRAAGAQVTKMTPLTDSPWVCVGYSNGDSLLVNAVSGQQISLPHASEGIRDIATTRDGRTIAVAANDYTVQVGVQHSGTWLLATWTILHVHVRKIAFTQDNLLIVLCTDGTVWLYSPRNHTWRCLMTGTTDLAHIVLDNSDNSAYIFDANGRLFSIDIAAARSRLSTTMNLNPGLHP